MLLWAIAVFASTTLAHAASVPGDPQFDRSIQWGPCDPSLVTDPSLSCGFFEIPLDYHNSSAGNGRLALVKANATGTNRLGTMFFNPGGPGVSGIGALDSVSSYLLNSTGGGYDIVSWDPRGVGSLTVPGAVFCFDSQEEYDAFWAGTVELTGIEMTGNFSDQGDISRLLAQAEFTQGKYEALGQRCLSHSSGRYLRYVGTAAIVRDIIALSDAIDGSGALVNFWGMSYGTLLGSWLINMFPERVGRVILDGVVDPVAASQQETSMLWTQQLIDSDRTYAGFYTGCALAGPAGCPIASKGQSPSAVNENILLLLERAHDAAMLNSSASLTSGMIRRAFLTQMYTPDTWENFTNTDFQEFVAAVAEELGQSSHATSNTPSARSRHTKREANDTSPYGVHAILCGDSIDVGNTTMADVFENIIQSSKNKSQMFSAAWPSIPYDCSFWPVRAVERYQGPFNKTLANAILVIGNTYDPATPLSSAQLVADLHASQARLVRLDTFGHTSEAAPSKCLRDIVAAYATDGTLPDGNITVCQADEDFEPFPGVTVPRIMSSLSSNIVG